jgi:hypothetical protein
MSNKVKILYVVGTPRCGSTVLSNILNEVERFFSIGEFNFIWDRGLKENWGCGCGKPFKECPVWSKVLQKVFDDVNQVDVETFLDQSERYDKKRELPLRVRHFLYMSQERIQKRMKRMMGDYLDVITQLYHAIYDVVGNKVIVDTSKSLFYGYVLSSIPTFDVYILHLVRDSRAVAYSELYRKKKVPGVNKELYMGENLDTFFVTKRWVIHNFLVEKILGKYSKKYLLLHYEDFAENPEKSLQNIFKFLGEDELNIPLINEREVELGINHSFSGNPNRFKRGTIFVRKDEKWKKNMHPFEKILITTLTLPGLLKYNYI